MIVYKILRKIKYISTYLINKLLYQSFGWNSYIQKPLMVTHKKDISIGKNCFIRDYARIETIRIWGEVKYQPHINIGNNVSFEQGIHITCANEVLIHDNCSFTPYCCITDIEHEYKDINVPVKFQPLRVGKTEIGENCFFGTGAKIIKGVTIGKHCIIGANAVVVNDIPSYSVVVGNPARIIKKYNQETGNWEKIK